MTKLEMHGIVKKQLLAYRKNRARLTEHGVPEAQRQANMRWCAAIDGARVQLRVQEPARERAMARLFGLDTPIPRYQPVRERVTLLTLDFAVSESTLYAWREEFFRLIIYAAIASGLMDPFGEKR